MLLWVPRASKMDAAGDQADIAKTYENKWFSMVLEVWRVMRLGGALDRVAGTLDGIWLADWRAGWRWLVVAGRLAGLGDTLSRQKQVGAADALAWGAQNHHIYH